MSGGRQPAQRGPYRGRLPDELVNDVQHRLEMAGHVYSGPPHQRPGPVIARHHAAR